MKLVILNQGMAGQTLPLASARTTIGLAGDNSFQISDSSLSDHHCELLLKGNEVRVRDLNSTHGSFINDEKITERVLAPGQTLRLGFLELKLEAGPLTPPAASPPAGTPPTATTKAPTIAPPPNPPANVQVKNKKKLLPLVAIAVVLLGLGIAAAVFHVIGGRPMPKPVGWWKLDEGSGSAAKDSSDGHHDGTLVNQPVWVSGKKGGALAFDGSAKGQYVALGNILQDSFQEISIACWVNHPTASWENIVERSQWDDRDGVGLNMDNSGTSVDFGHYPDHVRSVANVQDGQWHHVVGTMVPFGTEYLYSIYVDGKLDNTMTNTDGVEASTKPWAIGARYDGTWGLQGSIGDVRIYDHALTPREVERLYEGRD